MIQLVSRASVEGACSRFRDALDDNGDFVLAHFVAVRGCACEIRLGDDSDAASVRVLVDTIAGGGGQIMLRVFDVR